MSYYDDVIAGNACGSDKFRDSLGFYERFRFIDTRQTARIWIFLKRPSEILVCNPVAWLSGGIVNWDFASGGRWICQPPFVFWFLTTFGPTMVYLSSLLNGDWHMAGTLGEQLLRAWCSVGWLRQVGMAFCN
jgi:hypothetical protein